ncbi:hypothetical protein HZ994_05385 [Akkermansiaceae bacterium]|nr:hypothetical protein HZ994_05385 [Akkermansiaceae bacterium]
MKKTPATPLALLVGIGIGFFITKAGTPADSGHNAESLSPGEDASANPRTRPLSRTTSAAKATSGRTSSSPRSLAALLELTGDHWNGQDSITFLQAIEQLGADEIAALMIGLEKPDPTNPRRYRLCIALINRWAAIDPGGAWDAATQFGDNNLKQQMISTVIGAIARTDLGKARQFLSGIENAQTRQSALYAFVNEAASEDPEEVFRLLASEPTKLNGYGYYQSLFLKWAKDDPDAAIAKLDLIKGTWDRQQALQGIATALMASDPKRALDMLDGMTPGASRTNMLASITSTWMGQDSDAAIAWINGLPAADRSTALQNGIWQLTQQDPAKAAAFLSSFPPNNQTSHQYSQLAGQWAQLDPEAARKWAESLPAGQAREQAMNQIISTIARTDPAKAAAILGGSVLTSQNSHQVGNLLGEWIKTDQTAALAWLDSLDLRGSARMNVQSQIMHSWVSEDATAASQYALGIQDGKSRQQAISTLVSAWGNNDPVAARDWIMNSLEGDSRNQSLNNLIQALSYQDHSTALEYYKEATANLAPEAIEKTFGATASRIASTWVQHDPKAAAEWVLGLPEGESRSNSIQSLVDNYGNHDIKGAAEFVNTLAVGKERDQAVGALVSDLGQQGDPESAFDWATSISEASSRESMIRNAVSQWKEYDPAAARAAVAAADISNEARKNILNGLEN